MAKPPAKIASEGGGRLGHIAAALLDPAKAPSADMVRLDPEAMELLRSIDISLKVLANAALRSGGKAA